MKYWVIKNKNEDYLATYEAYTSGLVMTSWASGRKHAIRYVSREKAVRALSELRECGLSEKGRVFSVMVFE